MQPRGRDPRPAVRPCNRRLAGVARERSLQASRGTAPPCALHLRSRRARCGAWQLHSGRRCRRAGQAGAKGAARQWRAPPRGLAARGGPSPLRARPRRSRSRRREGRLPPPEPGADTPAPSDGTSRALLLRTAWNGRQSASALRPRIPVDHGRYGAEVPQGPLVQIGDHRHCLAPFPHGGRQRVPELPGLSYAVRKWAGKLPPASPLPWPTIALSSMRPAISSAIAKFFDVREILVQLKQGGARVELLLDRGRVGPHRAPYQGALRAAAVCCVSGPGGGPPPGAREWP